MSLITPRAASEAGHRSDWRGYTHVLCAQQWYGLADEAVEDALYDSQSLRDFCCINLARESVPDATTLMGFRHLLEANKLPQAILKEVNTLLKERGLLMSQGTLIDATLIAAPSSTKNEKHERDPDMHQAKKGNQWHPSTSSGQASA